MIALNTNVLIYTCDRSSPERQKRAFDLIDRATDGVLLLNAELLHAKASASTWTAGVITPTRASRAWLRIGRMRSVDSSRTPASS